MNDEKYGQRAVLKYPTAQTRRLRGYRIHVFRGAHYHPSSFTTGTIWAEKPPVEQWQRVIDDPATQSAWMIQSGRRMKQFQFRRR